MKLTALPKGETARISEIASADPALEAKLREIGFSEGDEVEVAHHGPIGGRPICTRLNQTLIALRMDEAAAISVEPAK